MDSDICVDTLAVVIMSSNFVFFILFSAYSAYRKLTGNGGARQAARRIDPLPCQYYIFQPVDPGGGIGLFRAFLRYGEGLVESLISIAVPLVGKRRPGIQQP